MQACQSLHEHGYDHGYDHGHDHLCFSARQSRRIRGLYTLTDGDIRASRHFEDSIARLGAYLLVYKMYDPAGLDYDVPYRCLVPEGIGGLLVAGRCVSSDYLGENTLRLIVPCLATGQGAGVAAALACRTGVEPRDLDTGLLRDALLRQRVHLGEPDGSQEEARGPAGGVPVSISDE